jgi:pimeloyl-ACP methyl ester carboxylesterase
MVAWAGTSQGALSMAIDRDPRASDRPVALFIHGALRNSDNLKSWFPILGDSFDVVIVDLPGHGRSPEEGEPSPAALVLRFKELVSRHFEGRDVVIVGESVGALIGLGLADGQVREIKGVLAADPPLTTAKQWSIFGNFTRRARKSPGLSDYLMSFMYEVFGYTADTIVADRIYYGYVAAARVPVLMLTGDVPLWPVRSMETIPCLLDGMDVWMLRTIKNTHISTTTIAGSDHLCLDKPTDQCKAVVRDFCAARLLDGRAASAPRRLNGSGH